MSRNATEFQGSSPSLPLPGDHVLNSGVVVYPGAFDQHGCPLVIFPVDAQCKLSSEITKEEVVDFINYFLCLHNKKQEKESLIALVADLRQASTTTARFIADTVRLLELHNRTVHTVYLVQPKKKDVLRLLLKLLISSKGHTAPYKRVLLKEVFELSNYIDKSQLTAPLGGYLVYCHQSWVTFIKEIDAFVQEFFLVVHRLPSCISTLQNLSRQPVPSSYEDLTEFCSTNEAKFQHLRRELGLDELLKRCECVVEKLRYPEYDPCYQAMAGTALFTHTAFDMLQNYSRITAAVEKIELLWQQAFSKAHVQLHIFQLCQQSQQITQQMTSLQEEKLQPYRIEIAKDSRKAEMLTSAFQTAIYTPAMALVRCAEDVIHTLAESLPPGDARISEDWVLELDRLKENLLSSVELPHQTLRAVSDFYHYYNKSNSWYNTVLHENFLQDLLWGVSTDGLQEVHHPQGVNAGVPAWRRSVCQFLAKKPSPDMAELVQLAHLANIIPDDSLQRVGKQLSQRCMTLRKLLTAPGTVPINDLQLSLQWQYEVLRTNHMHGFHTDLALDKRPEDLQNRQGGASGLPGKQNPKLDQQAKEALHNHGSFSNLTKWGPGKIPTHHQPPLGGVSQANTVPGVVSTAGKPPSLSSFDSGFDGAGSSHLEGGGGGGGREGWDGLTRLTSTRDSFRPISRQPQIHEENISSVSDSEDRREEFDFGSAGNTSRASIQIIPKVTVDSLNFEIKVKRSATLPQNPWLSLPTEDLEKSYTVTITQNPPTQQRNPNSPDSSERSHLSDQSSRSRDQPTQTETQEGRAEVEVAKAQESFDDSGLSPIRKLLSSTITDARERSQCSTDGLPTLLWDSYDLHNLDTCESSVSEVSLRDWDLKEQEGLQEVEKILVRAAGILEEEENVLAQEEMLTVLVKAETPRKLWPLWNSADQLSVMSTCDLVEAGVLGLEDALAVEGSECLSESTSFDVSRGPVECGDCPTEAGGVASGGVAPCRGELLKELRDLRVLDELIMEENVKIHKLRRHEEERLDERPAASTEPRSTSKERQMFQLELQREKREVERLERSLENGRTTKCKLKKLPSRSRKVVKCSVMERTSKLEYLEDTALCEELIAGSRRPCNTQLSTKIPPNADASNTDTVSFPESVTNQTVFQDFISPRDNPRMRTNISIDDPLGRVGISNSQEPVLASRQTTPDSTEDFGIQSQGVADGKMDSRARETVGSREAENSSKPEPKPQYGAFDPGGSFDNPPVPKPRRTQPSAHDPSTEPVHLMDRESEQAETQKLDTPPIPKERRTKPSASCNVYIRNPDANEHTNNNNNNNPVTEQQLLTFPALYKPSSHDPQDDPVTSTLTQVSPQDLRIQADSHCSQISETEDAQLYFKVGESPLEVLPDPREQAGVEVPCADIPDGFQRCGTITGSFSRSLQQPSIHIGTREMMNYKTPIVLDTGSGLMKAGFADQDLPSTIFPTIIGLPKYEEIMNGNFERETYIGHDAQHMRGVLTLKYPMKNGIISNWDDMEKIWHHTFQQLGVESDDHPVLLTEAAMNPRDNRQRMVELMFESFNVPLTYVAMQAVLALYAAGRSTGVVFDSGDGVSYSVPVFEGYCLPHAVQRFTMAGYDVTMHLKKLLQEQGVCMRTSAELEIVREIKEKCCCVAEDYESELTCGGSASREMHYTMPDGQVICLSTERFRAPEILFKPELIGRDHYGMHESIFKSILSSDLDLRRSFLGNVVLAGGNTLLTGLPERLQKEIRGMVPSDLGDCVRVTSPKDRDFSVWSGGAVLANLSSFASAWISLEEYEEFGPQIVFRKCF